MNKQIVKQTMLSLETRDLESAREKYLEYVGSARLDRSEPIEDDEQAQAELASDLSEALDDTVHSHSDKIEKLAAMDFGPKSKVEEGAVVKLSGRFFRYCRVDGQVCVRRQRDHGHLHPGPDLC
jgi:hypothetical protein